MKQEKRITYQAGITRTPSDFLCNDGELAECINLTTDNEELKPVVQPYLKATIQGTLVFVHKPSSGEDIYIRDVSGVIHFGDSNTTFTYRTSFTIDAVGNTVIVSDADGMHFFIWRPSGLTYTYKRYDGLPEFRFRPWLKSSNDTIDVDPEPLAQDKKDYSVVNTFAQKDVVAEDEGLLYFADRENDRAQKNYNEIVYGLYAKNKKDIGEKKGFSMPFFVRAALRLFDGTYAHISQPILMLPSLTRNTLLRFDTEYDKFYLVTKFAEMYFSQSVDLSDWSDIVKDIDIFVTKGVELYEADTDLLLEGVQLTPAAGGTMGQDLGSVFDGVYRTSAGDPSGDSVHVEDYFVTNAREMYVSSEVWPKLYTIPAMKQKLAGDIDADIKDEAIFYKIASIGLKPLTDEPLKTYIQSHTMDTLTSQPRLKEDDFYSHTTLYPGFMYSYNSRLNLSSVKRSMFEGFSFFMPLYSSYNTTYKVNILTDSGQKTVTNSQGGGHNPWYYFYYPDTRAKHVNITHGGVTRTYALTEHKWLNGAYYFAGVLAILNGDGPAAGISGETFAFSSTPETLQNYIITSVVDNPFVYLKDGYNRVGTGKIIGIVTTTMALSQDAYGRTDLIVFSENGVWGMEVDGTGLYKGIHPFTRDVCLNAKSITQVDGAAFFVSKKGLMIVTDQGVKCVSEQMNGKAFNTASIEGLTAADLAVQGAPTDDWKSILLACQGNESFLQYITGASCVMAYDYIDSRLLIINPSYGYAFVYSMADGSISKVVLPSVVTNVVNNYPDYLLEDNAGKLYTLYDKQREEQVQTRQTAFLLTRPMKLAGPLKVTSLQELANVGMWDKGTEQAPLSVVMTYIWCSDNLRDWYLMKSRMGAAAKYYRLGLYIKMLPTERLSGTIVIEEERRTNNQRV